MKREEKHQLLMEFLRWYLPESVKHSEEYVDLEDERRDIASTFLDSQEAQPADR